MSTSTAELRFDREVAVVTGAGSGLGRAYARELGARGASVVCNDVVGHAAEATAAQVVAAGGSAVAEASSVATAEGGQAIVQAAIDAFGSVGIVINNAGQIRPAPFAEMDPDRFEDVVRTHLFGAFHVTRPAFAHMSDAGHGRILFTSSSSGVFGSPWAANYAAAKTGVLGLSNVVATEGAGHGITSNVVMPQALGTGMRPDAGPPYPREYLEEVVEAFEPFGGHSTVDNVTPLVLALVHRSCERTQQVFSVGCGHVARVFVGATRGWFAPALECASVEQVAAALDDADDLEGFGIPLSAAGELRFIRDSHTEGDQELAN